MVASNEGPTATKDFFLVIRRFRNNTTKRQISVRLNITVAEVSNVAFQSNSTICPLITFAEGFGRFINKYNMIEWSARLVSVNANLDSKTVVSI